MPETPISLNFTSVFGNASLDADGYYTFPTGAEPWAGFAHDPVFSEADAISFPGSRTVTFNAYTTTDVNIKFRFEKNGYPDTEPSHTEEITIIPSQTSYEFTVGPNDLESPDNTFRSVLLYIVERDISVKVENVVVGATDATDENPSFKVFKEDLAEWVSPALNNSSFTQWGAGVNDDAIQRVSFGDKTFTLGENTYTHIYLQTNGWLQLTDASAGGSTGWTPTLNGFLQRPSIAIPWDDYDDGIIHYTPDCIDDQFIIVYETNHRLAPTLQVKITVTLNMDSHPSKAGNIELDIGEFTEASSGSSLMGVSYGDQSTSTAVSTIDFTDFTNGTEFVYPSIPVDLIEMELANALTMKKISFERSVVTTIADTTSPVITVTGDNPATIEKGSPYTDAGATASDNVDGDLTSDIVITGSVDTSVVGTYTINYSVTDTAGNTGTASRTVNVVDTTAPIITENLRSTINNGQTSLGSVSANEQPVTWSINNPDIFQIDGQGNVSLQQPANYKEKTSYSFTITATDPSNNTSTTNGYVSVYEIFTPETKDELITALNKWYEIANDN